MVDQQTIDLAKSIAKGQGLDPALVCAIIEQESGWNPWAIRYEPGFFGKYVAPLYTNNKVSVTEAYARSFSWGPMQVMGQVAREIGYAGALPQLCDFNYGVLVGCKVFSAKLEKAKGDVNYALLLWNGGANKEYPAQVLARVAKYK